MPSLLREPDRKKPHPGPSPLSLPNGLSPFDSHSAFWLRSPGLTLCSDSTALPSRRLPFLCKWLNRRRASPHQLAVRSSSICFVSMYARCIPTSSARNVHSSAPSLMTAPGKASLNCGFFTWIDLVQRASHPRPPHCGCLLRMNLLSPSMMPLRFLSCKPVDNAFESGYRHLSAGSPRALTR